MKPKIKLTSVMDIDDRRFQRKLKRVSDSIDAVTDSLKELNDAEVKIIIKTVYTDGRPWWKRIFKS